MSKPTELPIGSIQTAGTHARAEICTETVRDYALAMEAGAEFPPLVVFADGADYWLAEGFHRLKAALRIGRETVAVDLRQGAERDALLCACGSNAEHGLRRTAADKRRAVEILLRDKQWRKRSDRWIARQCLVGHAFVSRMRNELSTGDTSTPTSTTGLDGKVRARTVRVRVTNYTERIPLYGRTLPSVVWRAPVVVEPAEEKPPTVPAGAMGAEQRSVKDRAKAWFLERVAHAVRLAALPPGTPVDPQVIASVRECAAAWTALADSMEDAPEPESKASEGPMVH